MKLIYKTLSGLILSIIAAIAIIGLVSFSNMVKPEMKNQANKVNHQNTQIKMTHKQGICQHKDEQANGNISFGR